MKRAADHAPEGECANDLLSTDATRRLLISLIGDAQDQLIKNGAVTQNRSLKAHMLTATAAEIDLLKIDEDSLGFDSLSRLDLVLVVNRFFQLHTSGIEDYLLVRPSIGDWVSLIEVHLRSSRSEARFAFETSGSTGEPKTIEHKGHVLMEEVTALLSGPLHTLGENARVIALVPPHHIYGFIFTCLIPSHLGLDTIALYQRSPAKAAATARPGDFIVATPWIWEKLVQMGVLFASGVTGVSAAAPLAVPTWSQLCATGLSGLTEVYGATETGGIGYRTKPDQSFTLLSHLTRREKTIMRSTAKNTPLSIQDRLIWTGANTFNVNGRRDGIVQIAGVNVSPAHVAKTIARCVSVDQVDVRFDGRALCAKIVPSQTTDAETDLVDEIRTYLLKHLAAPARPTQIVFCDALARNSMGKVMP